MRKSLTPATVALVAILLALVTALSASLGARPLSVNAQTGLTPPPPPNGGTPVVRTVQPVPLPKKLTAGQQKQAINIMARDKTFKLLVQKRKYRVKTVYLWQTRKGAFLGGVVTVRFPKAQVLSGRWLDLDYDCTEKKSPPYGRVPFKAKYANVTVVTVYVDLKRKAVAGIRPIGYLVGKAHYPGSYTSRGGTNTC